MTWASSAAARSRSLRMYTRQDPLYPEEDFMKEDKYSKQMTVDLKTLHQDLLK